MREADVGEVSVATVTATKTHFGISASGLAVALGPLAGFLVWLSPLGLDPTVQEAFAVAAFMIIYWITEPIDHGITALIGCYLFWALHVAKFSVAFSGFASTTPWFLFGALLMGEAASRTGLAKRLGYMVMEKLGASYPQVLLGVIAFSFLLNFLIPSGVARLAVIAPIVIGIVTAFGLGKSSNVAKGLFIILTYTSGLFDKMIMAGPGAILTRGIVEEQTGVQLFWSQWLIAYLPVGLITIFASWLTIRWLYPAEREELPGGKKYFQDSLTEMGPWSKEEKRAFGWLFLSIGLWATDLIHQISPAVIGVGAGLALTLPKIGVLETRAVKSVNFLLVLFVGGALSMANVLTQTKALSIVAESNAQWMEPLLSSPFYSAIVLYWGGFLYHFFLGTEQSMISSSLPLLLRIGEAHQINPIALGLVWVFAGSGRLFVYQSAVLVLGYSYGYFERKDLLKVGAVLTIVEGILLMFLVPLYWPLIGLTWMR